jgi:hypothetical protein
MVARAVRDEMLAMYADLRNPAGVDLAALLESLPEPAEHYDVEVCGCRPGKKHRAHCPMSIDAEHEQAAQDADEVTQRELRTHRHDIEDARAEGARVGMLEGLRHAYEAIARDSPEETLRIVAEYRAAQDEPGKYDPKFGDDRECKCGHPYYRHFDTYEGMSPVGCKYCDCEVFHQDEPGGKVE